MGSVNGLRTCKMKSAIAVTGFLFWSLFYGGNSMGQGNKLVIQNNWSQNFLGISPWVTIMKDSSHRRI